MKQIQGKENMKFIMSLQEVAALAGITKEIREIINPDKEKETVQEMISKVMENYKDPEKHSFVSIKMDTSMNLVIEAEVNAVIRVMEILKKYVLIFYPLIKASYDAGTKLGQEIQEVVDDYTEKKEDSDQCIGVVVFNHSDYTKKRSRSSEDKKGCDFNLGSSFEDILDESMKKTTNKDKPSEKKTEKEKANLYVCPKCDHKAVIKNSEDKNCFNCGTTMEVVE